MRLKGAGSSRCLQTGRDVVQLQLKPGDGIDGKGGGGTLAVLVATHGPFIRQMITASIL